jgi:tetratricopeptide (TPR) repeat protein
MRSVIFIHGQGIRKKISVKFLSRTRRNRKVVYLKKNRLNEAVNEFITALKLKPDYAEVRYNLEICYERMKTMKR